MAQDFLKRKISPGDYMFYHGAIYRATQTSDKFVWLQYATGYQLQTPKRKYGSECLRVEAKEVAFFLLRQEKVVDNVVG